MKAELGAFCTTLILIIKGRCEVGQCMGICLISPLDWLDIPLRQGFGFSFLLHTEIWTQVETRFQNGEFEKVDSSVHANTNVPALYIQANDAAGSVNTIVMHCESHNIFSIAHEIRKCVLYMVHSNIRICSLCKKLPWAPWMIQELWTERSAAVTAPSSPQTNKFRGAKGMKTVFFCLFFWTRWCFYKKMLFVHDRPLSCLSQCAEAALKWP